MIYYGKGFTFSEVYNMPIYLRIFYLSEMAELREKENEEIKKENKKN
tara:strand:+ start:335 stop:475 length:141 start_codon:yes stop_codon:yes gene_type:complete